MSDFNRKFLSTVLMVQLVLPQLALAQTTNLRTDVTTSPANRQTSNTKNLSAAENSAPKTNLNSLAPTYTTATNTGPTTVFTTTTPSLYLDGDKEEGVWSFTVDRYGELATGNVKHDATAPICPPAPTQTEYDNGTDYYTANNLLNPWPHGLNGEWTNQAVYFSNDDATLCRDQLTQNGKTYVEKNYTTTCQNPDGSPALYYLEDYEDCMAEATGQPTQHTLSSAQMAGCKYSEQKTISTHNEAANFFMIDKVDNIRGCISPVAMIDKVEPLVSSIQIEHEGVGLAAEDLSSTGGNQANKYRADDGPMYLVVDLKDVDPTTDSGMSGLNWEPLVFNPDMDRLEDDIASAESLLLDMQGDLQGLEADIIVARSQILADLASRQNYIILNNLLNKVSGEINNNSNFFMVAMSGLATGMSDVERSTLDETTFSDIVDLIGRSKFDGESNISNIRDDLEAVNYQRVNSQIDTYTNTLPGLINSATVNEVGSLIDITSNKNSFDAYYNQWQIDKTKNYSLARPDWLTFINNTNTFVEDTKAAFDEINTAYQTNDLATLLTAFEDTFSSVAILNDLTSFKDEAQLHIDAQADFKTLMGNKNSDLATIETYLNNFNPATDSLNGAIPYEAITAYNEANNAIGALNTDLSNATVSGSLAFLFSQIASLETDDIFSNLIVDLEDDIRRLLNNISTNSVIVDNYESNASTLRNNIIAQEQAILDMREELAQMQSEGASTSQFETREVTTTTTVTAEQQLIDQCNADGGTVVTASGKKICRFDQATCKTGWSQFNNWTTTQSGSFDCTTTGGNMSNGVCSRSGTNVATGHAWANLPRESATMIELSEGGGMASTCGDRRSETTCYSKITQIGCDIPSLTDQTTTTTTTETFEVFEAGSITHLEIERLTGDQKTQQFFPPSTDPVSGNIFKWDLNLYTFNGEDDPIFTKAAQYKITLRAYDKAGNLNETVGYVTIKPASLEVNYSSNCNSAAETFYANNSDKCNLTIPQFDRFGNYINTANDLKIYARDQDINGSYNLIEELGANYQNGIRFQGGTKTGDKHVLTWTPDNSNNKTVKIRSILPNVDVVTSAQSENHAWTLPKEGGQPVPLILEHPDIGPRGDALSTPLTNVLDLSVNFKPWVNTVLSDRAGTPSASGLNPVVGTPFPVYAVNSTNDNTVNLPTDFQVNVTGFINDSFAFENLDIAEPGVNQNFASVSSHESLSGQNGTTPTQATIIAQSALVGQQDMNVMIFPTVTYSLGSETVVTGGQPIGVCRDFDECFVPPEIPPTEEVDVVVSCGPTPARADEGKALNFTLALDRTVDEDIDLYFNVDDVTASVVDDYTFDATRAITIPAGVSNYSFSVPTKDDSLNEGDETFNLVYDSYEANGVRIVTPFPTCSAEITDTTSSGGVADSSIEEGLACKIIASISDTQTEPVTFTLTPGQPGDSATANVDYDATPVNGTIPAGQSSVLISIPTIDDNLEEGDEFFSVKARATGGDITELQTDATCLIQDNDTQHDIEITGARNTIDGGNVYEGDKAEVFVRYGGGSAPVDDEDVTLQLETFELTSEPTPATGGTTCATDGVDYVNQVFNVTIPAGQNGVYAPLTGITTCSDDIVENVETLGVRVLNVVSGSVGSTSNIGVISIYDNTPPPTPSIASISTETIEEGETMNFTVTLDYRNLSDTDIELILALEDVSATGGVDYNNADITVTIPVGEKTGISSPVTTTDDNEFDEGTETFKVKHKATTAGTIDDTSAQGLGRIKDNDLTPRDVTILNTNATSCESQDCANGTNGALRFEAVLSAPHVDPNNNPLVLQFKTQASATGPQATAGDDYQAGTYQATFQVGDQIANIAAIPLVNDAVVEPTEYVDLAFDRVISSHTVGDTSSVASGTINDDDSTPPINVVINNADSVVTEGENLTFTASLSFAPSGPVDVTFVPYSGGTATAGSDYSTTASTITFTPSDYENKVIYVATFDDTEDENIEDLTLKVQSVSPSGALSGTDDIGMGLIEDNDTTVPGNPTLIIRDADPVFEGEDAEFLVGMTKAMGSDFRFKLRTKNGTAERGSTKDFNAPGTIDVVIPAGQTFAASPVKIATLNDSDDAEGSENFTLEFASSQQGTFADSSAEGVGIIKDVPLPPNVQISNSAGLEGDRAEFVVTLDGPTPAPITIDFKTNDITATNSTDYSCPTPRVIFATGEQGPKSIFCDLVWDDENEDAESFSLEVDSVTGSVSSVGTPGTATILNKQKVDITILEPTPVMENDPSGVVEFVVELTDGTNSIADLATGFTATFTPEDLTAIGNISFLVDGTDYRSGDIMVNFEPGVGEGSTFLRAAVEINNDQTEEIAAGISTFPEARQETFKMTGYSADAQVRDINEANAIIEDDDDYISDPDANVEVFDARREEGEDMVFEVRLSGTNPNGDVELTFKTTNGSAKGADYSTGNYTITIPRHSKYPAKGDELRIPTTEDAIEEGDEDFTIKLVSANPSSFINRVERKAYRQSDGSVQDFGTTDPIATIQDDDTTLPPTTAPDLILDDAAVSEGETLSYNFNLSSPAPENTTIQFTTNNAGFGDRTANNDGPNSDFIQSIASVSILAGESTGTAIIQTVEDSLDENDEQFSLLYSSHSAGFLNNTSDQAVITINDDDTTVVKPDVIITGNSAEEGNPITFTLSLEDSFGNQYAAPSGGLTFVVAAENNGSINAAETRSSRADKDIDFSGANVFVPAGNTQQTFSVPTIQDTADEGDETFRIVISSVDRPTEVLSITDTATGTITDNDGSCAPLDLCCITPSVCSVSDTATPGADVEGQVIVDESLCSGDACNNVDSSAIILGTSNVAKDIREEITRNAYDLIRGKTIDNANSAPVPLNESGDPIIVRNDFNHGGKHYNRWDIYVDDLPDGGVTYLGRDINLNGSVNGNEGRTYFRLGLRRSDNLPGTNDNPAIVSGRHTFVIMDSSINLIGDLAYAGPDDSLGIIVLNSDIENLANLNRKGQLTIYKNVKHVVGSLFTDGSLVSNVWIDAGDGGGRRTAGTNANPDDDWDLINGNWDYDTNPSGNGNQLGRQLILTGNLLSKNTLGAADLVPPLSPWNEDLSGTDGQLRAEMYDLNYIRRYAKTMKDTDGDGHMEHVNDHLCAKVPGETECYKNPKSFIIRVDPRVREVPAPGFELKGFSTLQ